MNEKTEAKYPKFCAIVDLVLLAFLTHIWWNLDLIMWIIY